MKIGIDKHSSSDDKRLIKFFWQVIENQLITQLSHSTDNYILYTPPPLLTPPRLSPPPFNPLPLSGEKEYFVWDVLPCATLPCKRRLLLQYVWQSKPAYHYLTWRHSTANELPVTIFEAKLAWSMKTQNVWYMLLLVMWYGFGTIMSSQRKKVAFPINLIDAGQ